MKSWKQKLKAVRLVEAGQAASVTGKVLGIPKATLENWVRLHAKGQLKGAGDKPVSPEQMELASQRAELARMKMERSLQCISGPASGVAGGRGDDLNGVKRTQRSVESATPVSSSRGRRSRAA